LLPGFVPASWWIASHTKTSRTEGRSYWIRPGPRPTPMKAEKQIKTFYSKLFSTLRFTYWLETPLLVQWKLLYVVTDFDFVFIWIIWSNWHKLTKIKITTIKKVLVNRRLAYCYHSVKCYHFLFAEKLISAYCYLVPVTCSLCWKAHVLDILSCYLRQ
jgi:hypothetical protein